MCRRTARGCSCGAMRGGGWVKTLSVLAGTAKEAKPAAVIYKKSAIADAARTDPDDILEWTTGAFGIAGRKRNEALMQTAMTDLLCDPARIGVRQRNDIGSGICTHHLSTRRKRTTSAAHVAKPRHLVLFPLHRNTLQILQLLHSSMDLARHVSGGEREKSQNQEMCHGLAKW